MPEMSADVERPNVSATAVETPTAPAPRAPDHPQTSLNSETEAPLTPTGAITAPPDTALSPAADVPRWRLAAVGYLLLILGFALALTIPHLRIKAGIAEGALVILSIASMLAATLAILLSFVLNLLRS